MKKIRIGIICPSEIAYRRFMPALMKCSMFEYVGLGTMSQEDLEGDATAQNDAIESNFKKAVEFKEKYGGKIFSSYKEIVCSEEIDAIYIPLPPALHYKWSVCALEHKKHVLVEKPSTTAYVDTLGLLHVAKQKKLAIHENYMFIYHEQLRVIEKMVKNSVIGDVRLYRMAFGFPRRSVNDFRYNKFLGGGALLDAGGYTVKLAQSFLGNSVSVTTSQLNYVSGCEVDMFGSATLANDRGITAQISFGMDNSYKCELEIWGSKGCIQTSRIFTAPSGFEPQMLINTDGEVNEIKLPADDAFRNSIEFFGKCILDDKHRREHYDEIELQSKLVEDIQKKAIYFEC